MKKLKKIVKRMILSVTIIVVVLVVAYLAFVHFYPSFGGDIPKERQARYSVSKQFKDGIFVNKKDVPKDPSFSEIVKISRKFFFEKVEAGRPDTDINVQKVDSAAVSNYNKGARLIWFGHSSFLLQIDDKNVLIDPMLSDVPAPHPWLGGKRFSKELPIAIEKLPKIDAVVISHDHYDHLDYNPSKN